MDQLLEHAAAGSSATELVRWRSGQAPVTANDSLAQEEPLEIRILGRCIAVTMRTPGHDAELAAGFLLSEGLIHCRAEIIDIAHCHRTEPAQSRNILNVFLKPGVEVDFDKLSRHVFASSSCGICGKASIEAVHQNFPPIGLPVENVLESSNDRYSLQRHSELPPQVILKLPDRLRAAQSGFSQTGGLHAAALFTLEGDLLVAREDVGRHNAVDKVIGSALLEERLPLEQHILLVSGRASFEIMQKALAARIPIVAAISAPSSLAVEFARTSGQTLVGFLRGDSMNIYCGAERIEGMK